MNFSTDHIRRAFELAEIPSDFAERIIQYLPEAVRQLETVQTETLNDFLGQFCIKNEVTEEEMKAKRKPGDIAKLRQKFIILAKQHFPKAPNWKIGKEIDRGSSLVCWVLKNEETRLIKQANMERMKNGG